MVPFPAGARNHFIVGLQRLEAAPHSHCARVSFLAAAGLIDEIRFEASQ